MNPRVTLAMPVFNGENYIAAALASLVAQEFDDIEFIITDNASTDATQAICTNYAARDPRIRYVRHEKNLGAAPNYNSGLELARGEFLKWCAHDDLISPNFVSACVAALDARPDAALAFGDTQCVDPAGAFIPWNEENKMGPIEDEDPARRFHKAIVMAGTCFPIFGLFRMETLRRTTRHRSYYGSDRALIAETALLGKCVLVNEAIFYNREHPKRSINMVDHAARSRWQSTSASRRAAMEHVNLLLHLIEIARRHPNVVSRRAALTQVAKLALQPRQIGRYTLDLIRYVWPEGGSRLRQLLSRPVSQPG